MPPAGLITASDQQTVCNERTGGTRLLGSPGAKRRTGRSIPQMLHLARQPSLHRDQVAELYRDVLWLPPEG